MIASTAWMADSGSVGAVRGSGSHGLLLVRRWGSGGSGRRTGRCGVGDGVDAPPEEIEDPEIIISPDTRRENRMPPGQGAIDWELIARHPRAYVGYSDLTPFLLQVVQRTTVGAASFFSSSSSTFWYFAALGLS